MPTFATDTDLLHWEPSLLRDDAAAVAQTLLAGTGTLAAGATFTIDSGSLIDAHVVAMDHVVALGAPINGAFPIVSVESATVLKLSVIYDQLYPDEGEGSPWAPGSGSGIAFDIRTFWPQRRIVSELLCQAAGVKLEDASDRILNPDALRRPCVLGALNMIYCALAAAAAEPGYLVARAEMYERLYRRALRAVQVEIDLNDDGVAEVRRRLNVLELHRA
jgi:hypothetical protein